MIVQLEPILDVFEEMAMQYLVNSRMEEKMSKPQARLRNEGGLYEVVVSYGPDRSTFMGNAGTTPELAKQHALNVARNLQADAQARLVRAQAEAIKAREVLESVEALVITPAAPKGWTSVGTDTPQI